MIEDQTYISPMKSRDKRKVLLRMVKEVTTLMRGVRFGSIDKRHKEDGLGHEPSMWTNVPKELEEQSIAAAQERYLALKKELTEIRKALQNL